LVIPFELSKAPAPDNQAAHGDVMDSLAQLLAGISKQDFRNHRNLPTKEKQNRITANVARRCKRIILDGIVGSPPSAWL
jgi:hypothetical protein